MREGEMENVSLRSRESAATSKADSADAAARTLRDDLAALQRTCDDLTQRLADKSAEVEQLNAAAVKRALVEQRLEVALREKADADAAIARHVAARQDDDLERGKLQASIAELQAKLASLADVQKQLTAAQKELERVSPQVRHSSFAACAGTAAGEWRQPSWVLSGVECVVVCSSRRRRQGTGRSSSSPPPQRYRSVNCNLR